MRKRALPVTPRHAKLLRRAEGSIAACSVGSGIGKDRQRKKSFVDLSLNSEQRQLVSSFAGLYRDLSTPDVVAAAEPLGHLSSLWRRLVETGALEMAVPAAMGGYGASLLDLAFVAEQHGRHIAPAPLIEAQVAVRLLARLPDPAAKHTLHLCLTSQRLTTIALRPAVQGCAELVPAGAIADDALVLDEDRLVLVPMNGRATHVQNLGCQPLGDVALAEGNPVLAQGPSAVSLFAAAVDEWRVLTAAALSGLASRSLEIAVAYVKERKAFGQPIGAFQSISHRLADRATEVDGCELLCREAAWSADSDNGRTPELAAMALAFAAETARDTTYDALHFHGELGCRSRRSARGLPQSG
jgi:alkylation response protein AidB-like acyl-CoA dehydrogenase